MFGNYGEAICGMFSCDKL